MELNLVVLLGLALAMISVLSFIIERLFFPSILAFIAIGVGVGFFWDGNETFKIAGEIGIIFLFFLLGLKFPLRDLMKRLKKVWRAGVLDIILALLRCHHLDFSVVRTRFFTIFFDWRRPLCDEFIDFGTASRTSSR